MGLGGQASGLTSPDSATHPGHGRQLGVVWRFPCDPYPKAVEKEAVSSAATVSNGEQQHGERVAVQGRERRSGGCWLSFAMRHREVPESGPGGVVPV